MSRIMKKSLFKRILIFMLSLAIILVVTIFPISASTDLTMYAIYDTSRNNSIVGYYTLYQLPSNPPIYDIDNIIITDYSGVVSDAIYAFVNSYMSSHDIDTAESSAKNIISNSISLESNGVLDNGTSSTITGLLLGYVESNFYKYQNELDDLINLENNYSSVISNEKTISFNQGYNAGLSANSTSSYNSGYDAGYSDGEQASLSNTNNAYLQGFNDGTTSSNGAQKFIYALFSGPFVLLSNVFHFKMFGIDFYQIVLTLVSFAITFWVIKFIISRVGDLK